MNFPATPLFAVGSAGPSNWPYVANYSALLAPMPPNVHVLSLLQLNTVRVYCVMPSLKWFRQSTTSILLRLVNIYEAGDDPILSQPVTVTLANYIKFGTITAMDERTLTAVCGRLLGIRAVK